MNRAVVIGLAAVGVAAAGGAFGRGAPAVKWDAARDNQRLVAPGDAGLERARARAREGLDGFLARAEAPRPGDRAFAVKIALRGEGRVEHVWVRVPRRAGDGFEGRIDNEPRLVTAYKAGQPVRFVRGAIEDWTFAEGALIRGNHTGCALLADAPEERRQRARAMDLACEG